MIGPGFLWMVSAAGSGELLFTPRMGAQHGYALLWALLAAVTFKWFINREVGRWAVCSGRSIIAGFAELSGTSRWAVWLILVPQTVVAVSAIAGLAGSAATALILVLPGDRRIWMVAATAAAATLVVAGRYRTVERTAMVMACALALASIAAAVAVGPDPAAIAAGLAPRVPREARMDDVLPWLGFMLSGAAGMMWYSYWIVAKRYGAAAAGGGRGAADPAERSRLRGWIRLMTIDCTVAVVGTLIVTLAFLVLGVELLRPHGLVPDDDQMASTLGRLLGDVFGPVGFWFMVAGVFVGFWDTVLSDQDGHGRLFANGIALVWPRALGRRPNEERLRRFLVLTLVTAAPIALYLAIGQPVTLLKLAGAIEAGHIPVLAALVLWLNRSRLPRELAPSRITVALTALAGLFFAVFAVWYVADLAGG